MSDEFIKEGQGNGIDLQALLIDNPKIIFTAIKGNGGALHVLCNGSKPEDIKEICTAYYLLQKACDNQIQKIMQSQKPNIVVPSNIINRLQS